MRGTMRWGRRLLFLLPAPAALLILRVCANHPDWVETHFSRRFYPVWATALGRLSAVLDDSLAEKLLIGLLALVGLCALARIIQAVIRRDACPMLRCLFRLLCAAGAMYAIFVLTWGLHFARMPIADAARMEVRPTSGDELTALCNELLDDALSLRARAREDSQGAFALPGSLPELLSKIPAAYQALTAQYPFLTGDYPPPKPATFNMILSQMQIMGIYIPFTGEALLNPGIPAAQLGHTAAHEAAHQQGFAREAEADFVGYLACMASADPTLAYSGTLAMLRYAALSLNETDPAGYAKLAARFSAGIARDYAEQFAYWKRFDTPIAGLVSLTNERYLSTFALKTGTSNQWSDVVALLLAHYRQQNMG